MLYGIPSNSGQFPEEAPTPSPFSGAKFYFLRKIGV